MGYNWIGNAGHGLKNDGGFDPGAIGPTGLREADVTKKILDYWVRYMQANGAKVVLAIQDGDLFDIYTRANQVGAETPGDERFVSFHINSSSSPDPNGEEVYALAPGGEREALAKLINAELAKLGFYNRGVKNANFAVLRETDMPAVLVEAGFISNPGEEASLKTEAFCMKIAKASATGCLKHEGKTLTVDPFNAPTNLGQTRPVLSKGAKGPAVVEAQNRLLAWGYALPQWGADGDYGDETIAAVKAFQADHGLQVDGWIGANTWDALLKDPPAQQPEPAPAPVEPPAPVADPEKEALKDQVKTLTTANQVLTVELNQAKDQVAELAKYKAAAEIDLEKLQQLVIDLQDEAAKANVFREACKEFFGL